MSAVLPVHTTNVIGRVALPATALAGPAGSGVAEPGPSLHALALAGALSLHALVLLWMTINPVIPAAEPLVMRGVLIAAPIVPEPVPIAPAAPEQVTRPAERRPVQNTAPSSLLTAAADAPVSYSAQAAEPPPAPTVAADSVQAAVHAPSTSTTPAPPAVAVPVSAPRFNADYLINPAPAYPPLSRRMNEEGRVLLRVMVDADGNPSALEIHTSSGFPRLDQAALDAVRRWKFVPARRGDEAIAGAVNVPIDFRLRG
ncbi:MAG TPA: energy transducer TonB [Methyloversatilis sp.]